MGLSFTQQALLGTDRAANVELTETVPDGEMWQLRALSVTLVQGAAQTPQPILVIDDDTALGPPENLTGTTNAAGGNLAANTYYYVVTALNSNGETTRSDEFDITTVGATSVVDLTWDAVAGATGYRVYRDTVAGNEDEYWASATTTFQDTGAAGSAGSPPSTDTTPNRVYESFGASAAQGANTTARYTWGVGLPQPAALAGSTPDLHGLAALVDGLWMPAGWRVRTVTLGIGVNTNYGRPALLIRKI